MKYFIVLSALFMGIIATTAASGHGGGTDANGCHNDHKNGGYHCH